MASATVPSAAASAEVVGALPWQTITSGEIPNVRGFIALRSPGSLSSNSESLRTPAIALIPACILDLVVSQLFGGGALFPVAIARFAIGTTLAVYGIRTARQEGPLRRRTSALARIEGTLQLASLALTLALGIPSGAAIPSLGPTVIAGLACFALTLRIVALSGRAKQ